MTTGETEQPLGSDESVTVKFFRCDDTVLMLKNRYLLEGYRGFHGCNEMMLGKVGSGQGQRKQE